MRSLRRFLNRVVNLAIRRAHDDRLSVRNISLCKPPKIFAPAYHPLRPDAKPS